MPTIASSATSVLIAHVAAHTERIRVGAGGIMLPNHSPLTIAEQFGTLGALHPGRIDLGLGRAPGGDRAVFAALRRSPADSDHFPDDVVELRDYLAGASSVPGVQSVPHAASAADAVPLYILGSSLFGAQLAAALGLPYAFASHFAPAALHEAVRVYRDTFRPSDALAEPYVIAGVSVYAAEDPADAATQFATSRRRRVRGMIQRGTGFARVLGRRDRRLPGKPRRRADRANGQVHGSGHAVRRRGLPGELRRGGTRRRAHHRARSARRGRPRALAAPHRGQRSRSRLRRPLREHLDAERISSGGR